jgi:protein-S-isoprenylcysteine O-methyltransferase Ste14
MFEKILRSRIWPALNQFIATSFIFLGLAVLAWGAKDIKGFLSNPVRAGFVIVVLAQALINAWMMYRMPPHPGHEHRFDLARWHSYMFETIFVLAAFGDRRYLMVWNENVPLRWLGLGIYLIGLSLSIWANITWVNHLRNEGEHAFAHPVLLFDGPYRWIRYPSMLNLAIYCLGFAIMFRSWLGLILMVPLIWGIINRIDNMEKVFAVEYKRNWPLRRLHSKRLIPYLY